jgi:crotonobetainyl-CoA:carnitine CoA-transferase CaiB-like acyl-CoA transferase
VTLPLDGVRVVDLSFIVAGPLASRLLADFGADVVRIESRMRIDGARVNPVRLYGELPGDANSNTDASGYFNDVNAGKRSCTLNLNTDAGVELLHEIVRHSDVICSNLASTALQRWGIDYEQARELKPDIIVVHMPTMETEGPRSHWKGFGDPFAGAGGLKSVSGHPGAEILPFGHHYPDFSANPFHAAVAVMAALHHRERTGEGQAVELSQYEATASMMGASILRYTANDEVATPVGNRDDIAVPHNVYRCRGDESWCAIAAYDDEQWQALCEAIGDPALDDEGFATAEGRRAREQEIDEAIERWTVGWDRQQLAAMLQQRGVPAGPFQNIEEMTRVDPTLGPNHFAKLDHPVGREFLVHQTPIHATRNPAPPRLAPLLGADTFDVLTGVLGLSEERVAEYAAMGALD